MLNTGQFGVLMLAVFILELVAAIYAHAQQGHIAGMLVRTLNYRLHDYDSNSHSAAAVDFMQANVSASSRSLKILRKIVLFV